MSRLNLFSTYCELHCASTVFRKLHLLVQAAEVPGSNRCYNVSMHFKFWKFSTKLQGDMACNQGPCPTKLPDCTGSRSLISSVYLHRFSTVEQAVTIPCYASSPIWYLDDFKKVYFDRYFGFPSTSCPISYAVPLCIPLLPFSVIQFFILSILFSAWIKFFVTAIFRNGNFLCSQPFFRFLHFQLQVSTFHSLVFATSSSCRWWTTSQQLGPPHRSSLLLFSFLVLKAVGFEQSVQSKDKIKSLQVCVWRSYFIFFIMFLCIYQISICVLSDSVWFYVRFRWPKTRLWFPSWRWVSRRTSL